MWEVRGTESRAADLEADEEMVVRLVVVEHGDDHHATAAYVHQEVLVRCSRQQRRHHVHVKMKIEDSIRT